MMPFPVMLALQLIIGTLGPLLTPTAPTGLEVELRTVGNRSTFRIADPVPLEVTFRATGDVLYSIELADGRNRAPAEDRFLIEPSLNVIDRKAWRPEGIVCCDSRRSVLTSAQAVYPHELTDFVRFTEPGEYKIQYTTRRIFAGATVRSFDPSALAVSSNVLTIRIVKDDLR